METEVSRSLCSYSDCKEEATCGGHIWVKNEGVVISPICSMLKDNRTLTETIQHLEKNQIVVKVEMTEDMLCAERRYSESVRECDECGDDISDQPENHTMCKKCFYGRRKKSTDRNYVGWKKREHMLDDVMNAVMIYQNNQKTTKYVFIAIMLK